MASALQNLSEYNDDNVPDASGMTFAIVLSEWNGRITRALYEGCYDTLVRHGALPDRIHTLQVPGAFELPTGARMAAGRFNPDAVICLGCVIRGETSHHDYINHAVATGLVNLGIATGKPYIYGVLTTDNEQQAADRAGGKHGNKGVEAAVTAIRMAALRKESAEGKKKIGF